MAAIFVLDDDSRLSRAGGGRPKMRHDNYLADKTLDVPLGVQRLESPVSYRLLTSITLRQNCLGVTLFTEGRAP